MATRKRRRRHATAHRMVSGRRRRARAAVTHVNPHRRRRTRRAPLTRHHRRRRVRRNGLFSGILTDIKGGALVLGGQVGTAKARDLVSQLEPATLVAGSPMYKAWQVAESVAGALAVTLGARMLLPRMAQPLAYGAWAQAITDALGQVNVGGKPVMSYLAGYAPATSGSAIPITRRLNGYAAARSGYNVSAGAAGAGMNGYARAGAGSVGYGTGM